MQGFFATETELKLPAQLQYSWINWRFTSIIFVLTYFTESLS